MLALVEASAANTSDDIYEQALTELMRQHQVELSRRPGKTLSLAIMS